MWIMLNLLISLGGGHLFQGPLIVEGVVLAGEGGGGGWGARTPWESCRTWSRTPLRWAGDLGPSAPICSRGLQPPPQGKKQLRTKEGSLQCFCVELPASCFWSFPACCFCFIGPACSASCSHLQPHPSVVCASISLVKGVNYCNFIKVSLIPPTWTHPLLPFRVFHSDCTLRIK